jgi:hypothetical protein
MNVNEGQVIETKKAKQMPKEFEPFPVELLPEPIQSYVVDGGKALGCDPAFIAIPMLSILASAIGNSRCIKLKESWTEPAILWTALIGESGSMKTPAINYAMSTLKKMQEKAFREYDKKMVKYKKQKRAYDHKMKKVGKNDHLPDEPKEPVPMRYYCNDATIQAVAVILNNSPRGILQYRDELAGWFGSFNEFKGGKGSDQAGWLEMYQGGTLIIDRKTGTPQTLRVYNASVSICGGIQPEILRRSLCREYFENGLSARILLAMPPKQEKVWRESDIDAQLVEDVEAVFRGLVAMQMENDDLGGFQAKSLPLIPAAQDLWIAFYNEHGLEQAELSGDLAAVWSKLEAVAARLALIIHCVRAAANDPKLVSEDYIDGDSIAAGVLIVNWFKEELKRIYVVLNEDEIDQSQRKLIEFIRNKGGSISVRELQRSSRIYKDSSDLPETALQELVDIGWGEWQQIQAGAGGGRPSKQFVMKSDDKTTDGDA